MDLDRAAVELITRAGTTTAERVGPQEVVVVVEEGHHLDPRGAATPACPEFPVDAVFGFDRRPARRARRRETTVDATEEVPIGSRFVGHTQTRNQTSTVFSRTEVAPMRSGSSRLKSVRMVSMVSNRSPGEIAHLPNVISSSAKNANASALAIRFA